MKKLIPLVFVAIFTGATVVSGLMLTIRKVGAERLSKLPLFKEMIIVKSGEVKYVEREDLKYSEVDNMVRELRQKIEAMGELDNKKKELEELSKAVEEERREIAKLQRELQRQLILMDQTRWANMSERAAVFRKMDAAVIAAIFENYQDEEFAEQLVVMDARKAGEVMEAFAAMGEKQQQRIARINKIMEKITIEK